MCAGAIANARIRKLVYGAKDKSSEDNLCEKILSSTRLNHKVKIEIDENEKCSKILSDFFKGKRQ
jgi:tRNA(adenine34) deaminase